MRARRAADARMATPDGEMGATDVLSSDKPVESGEPHCVAALVPAMSRARESSFRTRIRQCGALLLVQVFLAAAVAEAVHYTLTPDIKTGRIAVELVWNTVGRTQSALTAAAKWGTVGDVPALIRDLRFEGATASRPKSTRWLLSHARGASVTCRYTVRSETAETDVGFAALPGHDAHVLPRDG